jgi:hypothetical protein
MAVPALPRYVLFRGGEYGIDTLGIEAEPGVTSSSGVTPASREILSAAARCSGKGHISASSDHGIAPRQATVETRALASSAPSFEEGVRRLYYIDRTSGLHAALQSVSTHHTTCLQRSNFKSPLSIHQ